MKTIRLFIAFLLSIGSATVLFQGCYTRLATTHDEESSYQQENTSYQQEDTSYQQEEQPADNQSYDNSYYNDDDYWHPRSYLGFSYYYPSWRVTWGWDGCIYPSYWDPWWASAYPYYGYYPYYSNWYSYPGYGYYFGPYGYDRYSHQHGTRNSGYQRGGNVWRNNGVTRSTTSGTTGTGAIYNSRMGSVRGNITVPNATSTGTRQVGKNSATLRLNRSGAVAPGQSSSRVSTGRSSRSTSQPSVQQSRTQSNSISKAGRSRGATIQRGSSSRSSERSSGQSSRSNTPAPSYTPPSQRTSPPPSAPASRNDGGEQRGSSSGRSRR